MMTKMRGTCRHNAAGAIVLICAAIAVLATQARAEAIKIGLLRTTAPAPLYIAVEKGYFTAEGLDAELVYFEAAQPVAVAAASGSVDFAVTGLTAGFYNLAGQGALRIIGSYIREAPGFQSTAYIASNRAYEAGLRSVRDFPGHSVGVTQTGSTVHYMVGLAAEKYGLDLKTIRVLPLQSNPNEVSAILGGQTDAALIVSSFILPSVQRGEAKLLGWVGDETPFQLGAAMAATRTADERRDTVERFLRAYRKAVREYHDAVTAPDGSRRDGPGAAELLAIVARYVGQPIEAARLSTSCYDAAGRLGVKDVLHQIDWYKAQGFLKSPVDGAALIDKRYVIPLPE